jgi:hypothetical protein
VQDSREEQDSPRTKRETGVRGGAGMNSREGGRERTDGGREKERASMSRSNILRNGCLQIEQDGTMLLKRSGRYFSHGTI